MFRSTGLALIGFLVVVWGATQGGCAARDGEADDDNDASGFFDDDNEDRDEDDDASDEGEVAVTDARINRAPIVKNLNILFEEDEEQEGIIHVVLTFEICDLTDDLEGGTLVLIDDWFGDPSEFSLDERFFDRPLSPANDCADPLTFTGRTGFFDDTYPGVVTACWSLYCEDAAGHASNYLADVCGEYEIE